MVCERARRAAMFTCKVERGDKGVSLTKPFLAQVKLLAYWDGPASGQGTRVVNGLPATVRERGGSSSGQRWHVCCWRAAVNRPIVPSCGSGL